MKKKPFRILEEHLYYYIIIKVFKSRKLFSFGLSTSIGYGGVGHPEDGIYHSYFEAKNAALHFIVAYHNSTQEQTILRKFRLMRDLDQPLLFDDV
jgi:hypothetical protein